MNKGPPKRVPNIKHSYYRGWGYIEGKGQIGPIGKLKRLQLQKEKVRHAKITV